MTWSCLAFATVNCLVREGKMKRGGLCARVATITTEAYVVASARKEKANCVMAAEEHCPKNCTTIMIVNDIYNGGGGHR